MSFQSFPDASIFVSAVVRKLPRFLVPLAVVLTTYLYLYPVFLGCVFPSTDQLFETAFRDTIVQHAYNAPLNPLDTRPHLAPFRLLVLADPQLEGDSSLPDPKDALVERIKRHWNRLADLNFNNITELTYAGQEVASEFIRYDIPNTLNAWRKKVDLFGNDYYLAHIYRTLHWWTKPTHVTVLGDLIGSQWVDDEEFEWRGWRYWNRVFSSGTRVPDGLMEAARQDSGIIVGMDGPEWRTRIINLAGNHDIGYAGDITKNRIERFEKKYGKANWDVRFEYPASRLNESFTGPKPMMHLVILNSMLLDTPALDGDLQSDTYNYLNEVITQRLPAVGDTTDFTLVLTHVPLHKKEGICVDAPMFEFWQEDECSKDNCNVTGLKEQNHLSDFASQNGLLQSLFGMGGDLDGPAQGKGRPGLVLTGHDHEGCDVWHYIPNNSTFKSSDRTEGEEEKKTVWEASRWANTDISTGHTGVREVTLRSMMGEFGGNAGLLSAWFDYDKAEWQYDIQMCKLGVQHIWWAIHILDLVALGTLLVGMISKIPWISKPKVIKPKKVAKQNPADKSTKVE